MTSSRRLGLLLIAPAAIVVVVFFLLPVALTAAFSFTTMSTATGIFGGAHQVAPGTIRRLEAALPEVAAGLSEPRYVVDEAGLAALSELDLDSAVAEELRANHLDEVFESRREAERTLRGLDARLSTREVKRASEVFNRSLADARFATTEDLFAALEGQGLELSAEERDAVAVATYTGWTWTTANFERMAASADTARLLLNTAFYVGVVLVLFNTTYAMALAIATHYLPDRPAGLFRTLWLLPRVTPPVIYVLMWKWLAWDTGFLSMALAPLGVEPRNWMLGSEGGAWVFVILINGFVGASMGMLVFASALRAIPLSMLHASEVDGASRWQQVRHVILPQLRWPILFVTCYQTLSLLASFELILLATDGGPSGATEVWSLAAYHTALNNYAGNLQYGYGSAMALVLVVVGIVLALLYLRLFRYRDLVAKPLIEQ